LGGKGLCGEVRRTKKSLLRQTAQRSGIAIGWKIIFLSEFGRPQNETKGGHPSRYEKLGY